MLVELILDFAAFDSIAVKGTGTDFVDSSCGSSFVRSTKKLCRVVCFCVLSFIVAIRGDPKGTEREGKEAKEKKVEKSVYGMRDKGSRG